MPFTCQIRIPGHKHAPHLKLGDLGLFDGDKFKLL